MTVSDELPVVAFDDAEEWRRWLARNHDSADGVWVSIAKRAVKVPSVRYPEVLEEALCFGWIDGRRERLDEERFLQRFTPRRARSPWSRVNREKAEALIDSGRMHAAGHAEVERARGDGRWERAYAPQSAAEVPADLQAQLRARPKAAKAFATLSAQNRYSILYRLGEAKRPETRVRRLEKFVAMLEAGETIHPQ